jgi:hypothetical protein
MRRMISGTAAIALCLFLLLSSIPFGNVSAAGGDGATTYRALLIGNTVYDSGSLRAPGYDVQHMRQLLLQQDFGGNRFDAADIHVLTDATKLQMLKAIESLAAQADGDDVTYFYYSGHGAFDGDTACLVGVEMALLGVAELKEALDGVQGRKVVIIDSCYAGGAAGRAAGSSAPAPPSKLKDAGEENAAPRETLTGDEERARFQESLMEPFTQAQPRLMMSRALTTSSYEVLTAASSFQYSYEYAFYNAMPGTVSYGPEFRMNGTDWAGGTGNWSGEFTGMLVAGAGRVSFSDAFPEIHALADADRDRRVTLDELYRYLRGAVLRSTVQVYPENDGTVVFEHAEADAPDWGEPVLAVADNGAAHTASPVEFRLQSSPLWPAQAAVKRAYLTGDNEYADNVWADIPSVATAEAAEPDPEGSMDELIWDGVKENGNAAGDGWYFAEIRSGSYKYPPVPFELARGVSNFPAGASALPQNAAFTASLSSTSSERWYTIEPNMDGLLDLCSTNASETRNPMAELYDGDGNLLFSSDDASGDDCNFELLRMLKAGKQYAVRIRMSDGSGGITVASRFTGPVSNGAFHSIDTSRASYTLLRPDTSGEWTVKAKSSTDDNSAGIVLYDANFTPVAWGDRGAESYRCLAAYLEAGRFYILETPQCAASMQVAAYGPGSQPQLSVTSMPALSASGTEVHIAHAWDTKYFRFTPAASDAYRFSSTSPMEGSRTVDSYAFLLDSRGYALDSDDDVNYDAGEVRFDFTARLKAGETYVLAVRAYVLPGQLSSSNPNLDFTVYAEASGAPERTLAISRIAACGDSAVALYDDDGDVSGGIGAGGLPAGWGESVDMEHDGITGLDFGEGLYCIRRYAPQLLYVPGGAAFTDVWSAGQEYVARDAAGGYYAWGISSAPADFGYIKRLDNAGNGLGSYDIARFAQGSKQSRCYFLDSASGKIYGMDSLGAVPTEEAVPAAVYVGLAASDRSLFALDGAGNLYAKGANRYGECGNGGTAAVASLARVDLPEGIVDFAAGANHAVALGESGAVYAWGCNDYGSAGTGSLERIVSAPAQVDFSGLLGAGEAIERVYAGGNCSAALTSLGRVFAWGANDYGQLGVGGTFSRAKPIELTALSPSALGSGRRAASLTFGPDSAYAVLTDGSVYVSGRNDCNQLGFVSAKVKVFTPLWQPDLRSSNNSLLSLKLSAGSLSPAFSPDVYEYNVNMPQGVALCTVTAAKADAAATMTMDGQPVASRTVNAGPDAVRMEIGVTAQDGGAQAYVLNFPHSPSSNAYLSSVSVSAGSLRPALSAGRTSYDIVIPETVDGSVEVTPLAADPNSEIAIDGEPGITSRTVWLDEGDTETMRVRVTAQLGNMRDYTFRIARVPMVSDVSASPGYGGVAAFSPGGANALTFGYTLAAPATVRIEVKAGGKWTAILNRAETRAGEGSFLWDGSVGGKLLPPGLYEARVTPYYVGVAGKRQTLSFRVLPKPCAFLTMLSPSTLSEGGQMRFAVRWTRATSVKVEVVTLSGKAVRTLYDEAGAAPGRVLLTWDGCNAAGLRLPGGHYWIRITCGTRVVCKDIAKIR